MKILFTGETRTNKKGQQFLIQGNEYEVIRIDNYGNAKLRDEFGKEANISNLHYKYLCENDRNCPPMPVSKETKVEKVNHPLHYNQGKYEAIDVIEDWELNFNLGNCVKYISRCNHKGNKLEDLKKALWYLEREVKNEERK